MRKIKRLNSLIGQTVTLYCTNYIYVGKLVEVTPRGATLEDCAIVYETGDYDDPAWRDVQKMNADWTVCTSKIESFGVMKKVFPVEKP